MIAATILVAFLVELTILLYCAGTIDTGAPGLLQ